MSNLVTADYVLLGAALALAVLGAFGGFSGALAFLLAAVAGGATGKFSWDFAGSHIENSAGRALAVLAVSLVVFGVVRAIVRKFVSKALAQPADAFFGFLAGAATGAILAGAAIFVAGPDGLAFFQYKGTIISMIKF